MDTDSDNSSFSVIHNYLTDISWSDSENQTSGSTENLINTLEKDALDLHCNETIHETGESRLEETEGNVSRRGGRNAKSGHHGDTSNSGGNHGIRGTVEPEEPNIPLRADMGGPHHEKTSGYFKKHGGEHTSNRKPGTETEMADDSGQIKFNAQETDVTRFRDMGNYVLGCLQKNLAKRRIVHDIVPYGNDRRRTEILEVFRGVSFSGRIFIASEHEDHFHVLHDCTYGGSRCKCSRIVEIRKGK